MITQAASSSIVKRRDESNFNAFYDNINIRNKREETLQTYGEKTADQEEDEREALEVKIVSKNLDVSGDHSRTF